MTHHTPEELANDSPMRQARSLPVPLPWRSSCSLPCAAMQLECRVSVFGVTLVLLYLASTCTTRQKPSAQAWLRKVDHASIYLLIAGTYTPFVLGRCAGLGMALFGLTWGLRSPGSASSVLDGTLPPALDRGVHRHGLGRARAIVRSRSGCRRLRWRGWLPAAWRTRAGRFLCGAPPAVFARGVAPVRAARQRLPCRRSDADAGLVRRDSGRAARKDDAAEVSESRRQGARGRRDPDRLDGTRRPDR